ncbi:zinc finger protein 260-like [Myripristis murdjan]|uniref:zinc finger protein 260-like n=1 Tax=Myripristis murdjan TaxID=586833 RepID=UPI00117612D9|nr:zinc finger protein 260-like [Myripristis murdjan]
MRDVRELRSLVQQRLAAAAEEIFGLFERTIAEYEEENRRQRRLLDAVLNPEVRLHPAVLPRHLQRLDQEEPEPPHLKEEQEELPTNQEAEQLQGLTRFPVKSEDDEEEALTSTEAEKAEGRLSVSKSLRMSFSGGRSWPAWRRRRLVAAVQEIFGLFERTMAELEASERQRRPCDAVLSPDVQLSKEDVQQLLGRKEEVPPEQQEQTPSLDQEEPEPPPIKEEQEELWTNQEAEQLHDLTTFPVKSEDDEEEALPSQLHQSQTEESRGAVPPASSSTEQMETEAEVKTCLSSEAESEDGDDDWQESREPRSGTDSLSDLPLSNDRSNIEEKPFSCSVCRRTFAKKQYLVKHMIVHTGEKPFSCSVCGKTFAKKQYMTTHVRVHTGEKPFSCSVCGKSFVHKKDLQIHVRIHTGEKPFKCHFCDEGFHEKGALQKHVRIHTGEKRFTCSVCAKAFADRKYMIQHLKVHSGEKPFCCTFCGKSFVHNKDLKIHVRVHTGETPFSCNLCGKGFREKGALQKHERVHTGEKPFSCPFCDKTFSQNSNMRTHMRLHTGE